MTEGRDLRNKIIYFGGELYAAGGNLYSCEKFNSSLNKWTSLPNYRDLVSDNLDSWCCGLLFE